MTIDARLRQYIEWLAAQLDPQFPSVVVPGSGPVIDEPASGYEKRLKPDFVLEDDRGWK